MTNEPSGTRIPLAVTAPDEPRPATGPVCFAPVSSTRGFTTAGETGASVCRSPWTPVGAGAAFVD